MLLNPSAFNQMLGALGEDFLWRRAHACACLDRESGAPRADCPACDGKGRIWEGPVQARAGVASSSNQQQWAKMGLWEQGDLVLSIPENSPMYEVAQFDRAEALTNTDDFSLPFIHGDPTERIAGTVVAMRRCFTLAGADIVDLTLPAINADGRPVWAGGGGPAVGQSYTITGTRRVEYYCFGQFSNDRFKQQGARLPRKMVMRRFDLLGR